MCLLFLVVELGHFLHFAMHQTWSEQEPSGCLLLHTVFLMRATLVSEVTLHAA